MQDILNKIRERIVNPRQAGNTVALLMLIDEADKKLKPENVSEFVKAEMDKLSDMQRYDIIHKYCLGCGSKQVRCYCLNDI